MLYGVSATNGYTAIRFWWHVEKGPPKIVTQVEMIAKKCILLDPPILLPINFLFSLPEMASELRSYTTQFFVNTIRD